jgi:hypothetical protein
MEMQYEYQGKRITKENLINKIGERTYNKVIALLGEDEKASFTIDIDCFRGGLLTITK